MIRKNALNLNKKKSLGQGMTEYIIIVGVIAVAAIGVFGYFGDVLEQQTAGMAAELSGGTAGANIAAAQVSSGQATTASANHKNLGNYNNNSQGTAGGE